MARRPAEPVQRRPPNPMRARFQLAALSAALLLALPARSYDYPLSAEAIRDAYTLGTRQDGSATDFLAKYSRPIPELRVGDYVSAVRIETPFVQVFDHSTKTMNYSAQDAYKDFYGKPLIFRMYLDICYEVDAPPDAVEIKVTQDKKEIVPSSFQGSSFYPAADAYNYARVPSIGEQLALEFKPGSINSATLKIEIDTPDGQHAEATFDLTSLR